MSGEAEARRPSRLTELLEVDAKVKVLEAALAKAEQERDYYRDHVGVPGTIWQKRSEAAESRVEELHVTAEHYKGRALKAEQERDEKATEAYENGYALGLAQGWEKGQARERELREALYEQWEGLHCDHCSDLVDGVCPKENTTMGCQWPKPVALQATQEDGAAK